MGILGLVSNLLAANYYPKSQKGFSSRKVKSQRDFFLLHVFNAHHDMFRKMLFVINCTKLQS